MADLTTGSTVAMISDKIGSYISTIPTDPGKGVATIANINSCILTGDSFGYYTDTGGSMFAITALMESEKGNTTNCLGVVNSNKQG